MSIEEIRHNVQNPHTVSTTPGVVPGRFPHLRQAELPEFAAILRNKISKASYPVKFSAHAVDRLASRKIVLSDQDMTNLTQAVEKIAEMGGKESLLVMGDLAFVISVENRTVITAMNSQSGDRGKVFTNIDSALILTAPQPPP